MKLAILFWFYKEPEICINRLQIIRKHNPNIKIFAFYGGDIKQSTKYKKALSQYLDDFYISFKITKPKAWKWINGDLMILDWYDKRGKNLTSWDSVVVVQWDMLVLGNVIKQFPKIKKNEIFISGTRVLDTNIERRWHWTKFGGKKRNNYLAFKKYIANHYNYNKKLLCSLFILEVFPRIFFEKWLTVRNKEIGMLEYKIPTLASIFKIPFYKRNFGVLWYSGDTKTTPLNAQEIPIEKSYIDSQLSRKNGFRIFHPYFKKW